MVEKNTKRRAWVKNAVIVFLTVLLILTFFSNTIMNRSLPEVETRYSESGTITAKIRGTATIVANEDYEVELTQTRQVQSVNVKPGDQVEIGDTLLILKKQDSTELEQAQTSFDDQELIYQKALITASSADYAKENRDIRLARETLEEAKALRDSLSYNDAAVASIKQNIANQNADVASKKAQMELAQDALNAYESNNASVGNPALKTAMDAAKAAWDAAESKLTAAQQAHEANYQALEAQAKSNMRTYVLALVYNSNTGVTYGDHLNSLPESEKAAFESIIKSKGDSEWSSNPDKYISSEAEKSSTNALYKAAYNEIKAAKEDAASKKTAYDAAAAAYNSAFVSPEYDRLKEALATATAAYESSVQKLGQLELSLSAEEAKKDDWATANTAVRDAQTALEDLLFALADAQKTDGQNQATDALDLAASKKKLDKLREDVAELKAESTDATVVASVSGLVKSINVSSGNNAEPNVPLIVIEVADRGYSATFSVTNEQSKRVKIGDSAEVMTSYWGSNITATLAGIKPDPLVPSNRVLIFSLKGEDLESDTQINITLAQRSATYDTIVPNQAVREDSNGTFVLIIEVRSTPLGNRYIAKRIDVQILATDDTHTAVSGALSQWGDPVITTSTKPIQPNDQVRMAGN